MGAKAPAPLMEMDMKEEQDDLTLVYMFGYKNGKDSMKGEIERLLLIEQGAADLCDKCGWRMKFPNEECRNCENAKLREETKRLLEEIQQLKHDSTIFINERSDAICENFDLREENAELREIAIAALKEGEKKDD